MQKRPASIKVRALQWLAQREHSRSELRVKLLRLMVGSESGQASHQRLQAGEWRPLAGGVKDGGVKDGGVKEFGSASSFHSEVDALLDWLTTHGYLSEARFVESRVHARQQRFGNLRIQQELKHHGVGLEADAHQALKASEFERAQDVWRKKFGAPAADAVGRVRQMRFLTGRGFTPEVIRRVVRGDADSRTVRGDADTGIVRGDADSSIARGEVDGDSAAF